MKSSADYNKCVEFARHNFDSFFNYQSRTFWVFSLMMLKIRMDSHSGLDLRELPPILCLIPLTPSTLNSLLLVQTWLPSILDWNSAETSRLMLILLLPRLMLFLMYLRRWKLNYQEKNIRTNKRTWASCTWGWGTSPDLAIIIKPQ